MNENNAQETQSQLVSPQLSLWDVPRRPKPDVVPFARNSETSRESAERLSRSGKPTMQRQRILAMLEHAPQGLTRQEAAAMLDCPTSDLCAAFLHLERAGRIVKRGKRTNPRTGNNCDVFMLATLYRGGPAA